MSGVDEVINKSLEDIETMIAEVNKAKEDVVSKAIGDREEVSPDEVSEDTPPVEGEGEEGEGQAPEGEEEDTPPEEDFDESQKSLEEDLTGDEGVRKALEVSEFLTQLVKSISDKLEAHGAEVKKSVDSAGYVSDILGKSFEGIVKSQKVVLETQTQLLKSFNDLADRIGKLEAQPMVRKSVSDAKVKVVGKSFDASSGNPPKQESSLSKSEALQILTNEVQKGNHGYQNDVLMLESLGDMNVLSSAAQALIRQHSK